VTNRRQSAAPVPPLLFGSPETKFVNLPPTGPPVLPPAQNCGPLSQTQVPSTALSLAPSQRSAPPSKPLTNVFSPEDAISARLQPARHAESDVKRHPTVTFRSTQIREGGGGSLEVAGELTIRGTTRRVALEVELSDEIRDPWGNVKRGVSAAGRINRKDFDVNWNTPMDGGGLVVGDMVEITLVRKSG